MAQFLLRSALKVRYSSGFRSRIGLTHAAPLACIQRVYLSTDKPERTQEPTGIIDQLFGVKSCEASPTFTNRWAMTIPAFLTQMSIGSTWAWSLMGDAITREIGFVAPVAADWSLSDAAYPLSLVFVVLGGSAAVLGPWQNRVGPRKALALAACSFGGGLLLGAAGIYFHVLPLLYLGYGVMGGAGLGLAYTPPIQTLIQWFPDKRGTASGLAIAGFGSGALVFTPVAQTLMQYFARMPEYVGPTKDFVLQRMDGKMFAEVNGSLVEVVEALSSDIAKLPYDLAEGLYVVGSGGTGATEALAVLGAAYSAIIMGSALAIKKPHPSYVPAGYDPSTAVGAAKPVADVPLPEAIRSRQFHLLGITFTATAMGGMGMFSVAKPMMSEVFSGALPQLVTSSFAATFILMLAAANLGGRLGWAAVSDYIGRRKTFYIFTLMSVPLYMTMPYHITSVVDQGSSLPLFAFIGSTVACISFMGGTYAILPAYQSDLFGAKNIGPTHGVMMTYSAAAALMGPTMLLQLRKMSEISAFNDLLTKVCPETFARTFGAPMDQAADLFANKTVTIAKLLTIAPPGTLDPSPHLYDTTMYAMSGLMIIASLAHMGVTPYVPKEVLVEAAVQKERILRT